MDILIKYLKKKVKSSKLKINELEEKVEELQDEINDLEIDIEELQDEVDVVSYDRDNKEEEIEELKKTFKYDGDPINMQYLIDNIQVKLNQLGPVKLNELIEKI